MGREMGQIFLFTYKDPRSTISSPSFIFRVTISTILTISCAILSVLAAHKSYIAIINLRKYEEKSERAAKYSQTAADQLWKTRVTQGSSASVIALSLISSIAFFARASFSLIPPSSSWAVILPLINTISITAAFQHNRGFWKAKAKIPFVEGFNEGIQMSTEIRELLVALGVLWVL
ncbi:MAG: hypothetical protein HETSPECPRED_008397 [Heterodermia speciosa]|uniref:Uncharacterized protein n=1 Tax=Heterodermia speciosa TaxID=116794 RepID=A0A8H3IXK4_9LECA|nr:MAG: hypothetical protein HETSPECPRED_008397 [Heterodermia speciosa]